LLEIEKFVIRQPPTGEKDDYDVVRVYFVGKKKEKN